MGLVGLRFLWILVKRRSPVVAIADQTLEWARRFRFNDPLLRIDEIHGVTLVWRTLVVETRC